MGLAGSETSVWRGVSATRKNCIREYDKPNEDFAIVDNEHGIFMVLDGVSRTRRAGRPYVSPSPAAVAAELFGTTVHTELLKCSPASDPEERLRRAASVANAAVAGYNRRTFPEIDYLENNPAGCVGVLGLIEDNQFHYAYLGDCSGRLLRGDEVTLFTCSQLARLTAAAATLGPACDARTVLIRRDICNNPAHECGYGVFNGAPAAMDFLVTGSIPLRGEDIILLATDGLDPLFESMDIRTLRPFRPEELIDLTEECETRRPGLRPDDKTVVVIRRGEHPSR